MDTEQIRGHLLNLANEEWDRKCASYTSGSSDELANFRRIAEVLKIRPEQVACVYLLKHVYSLVAQACGGESGGEDHWSRAKDALNFCSVILKLLDE